MRTGALPRATRDAASASPAATASVGPEPAAAGGGSTAREGGARVGRAVVLDRQDVVIGLVRVGDREIELVGAAADLVVHDPAALDERARDRRGDRARGGPVGRRPGRAAAVARERQELD